VQHLVLSVSSVRKETPSTRVVRANIGGRRFTYKAGQAATIAPAGAPEGVPYSIASAPAETAQHGELEFLIKVHADGLWGNDFEVPRLGTLLDVTGPVGSFVLPDVTEEERWLFIAGGTGIAPLRSMIRQALMTRRSARMRLLYSARTPADFAYAGELRQMARRGKIELTLTTTREAPPRWRGRRGRITADQLQGLVDDPRTLCFVCGPAAMVQDVPLILGGLAIASSRIRLEEWT
jgi:ferredoxin-NADP reductase